MCWTTKTLAGMYSSCSWTSSPMRHRGAPHSGQVFCSSERSWTTGRRWRWAGRGLRPWPFFGGGGAGGGAPPRRRAPGGGAPPRPRGARGPTGGRAGRGGGVEDVGGEEEELVGIDPLGLLAVGPPQEPLELVLELLVEEGLLAQRLDQLADELMAGLQVGGELVARGRHTPITDRL